MRKYLTVPGLLLLLTSMSSAGEPLVIGSRLELLTDHYVVEKVTGDLELKVQQPEPGDVVLVTDKPWEGNTCAYYTIFQDGDIYRMYYRGSHSNEKKQSTHPEVTCYAESRDGIHWEKPELGIVEFNGSKANNIILEGLGSHCFVAFKDENPHCPPDAKYKGISRGRPHGQAGLYVFQSADGIHWKLMRDEPVITKGAFDSQNLAFWDPHTRQYVDYHRIFVDGVRNIMTAHSDDFVNWSEPVLLKYPDAPSQHLYTNAICPYFRAPHLRIGFPTRFIPREESVEPVFMSSRDGVTFHRFNEAVVPQSAPEDRAGNRSNYMANGLVTIPGEPGKLSVYATEAYYTGPDSRLRRFTYRVDGFVAVQAGEEGGDLLTKPMEVAGTALTLNYKTSEDGFLQVELLDEAGAVIAASGQLGGDETAGEVQWRQEPKQSPDVGPVQLRIRMKNADLFAFRFGDQN